MRTQSAANRPPEGEPPSRDAAPPGVFPDLAGSPAGGAMPEEGHFLDLARLPPGLETATRWVARHGLPSPGETMTYRAFRELSDALRDAWRPALRASAANVANALIQGIQFGFAADQDGRTTGAPHPSDGRQALGLQLGLALGERIDFHPCLECDKAFALRRKEGRDLKPRMYCSETCRSRAKSRRRECVGVQDDARAFDVAIRGRRETATGPFPLCYSGVGPGVACRDWTGAFWDLACRGEDLSTIGHHLGLEPKALLLFALPVIREYGIEPPEGRLPLGERPLVAWEETGR